MAAILKMATGRNCSMSGINSGHHNLPTYEMSLKSDNIEFVRIVAAILKMATGKTISMSGINSGHHYVPKYQILMISDNVKFLRYRGGHFENDHNSGHHYLPTYHILMISDNVDFVPLIFYAMFWRPF